ncbi:MAG TPA: hypothetical protein PKD91_12270 [Bacteroidia bacterium]|nr:hypothetical protein [Bacteroidia bacterium]
MSQGELKFFSNFPTKETLKLLLEWQALYAELVSEKKRLNTISVAEALKMLDIPARKLTQYIKEGYIKQKPSGEIYKYQVLQLLFEVKQEELYQSIQ